MGKGLQLIRSSAALKRTVLQSVLDYRRQSRRSDKTVTADQRAEWLHKWSAVLLSRLGIPVMAEGPLPGPGLIVSNHLSYLDILAISVAIPAVFVSKAEVQKWPVFGKLTDIAGTVYVDRTRKSGTREANEGIRQALEQGMRVVIFPEGTSSDGSNVLPFYPSLFEPAVECGAQITAAHVSYSIDCGDVGRDIAYWGEMTFFPHLLKLLSKRGMSARVTFAEQAHTFTDRKVAASEMREEVLRLHRSNRPTVATS
jgi:1-acyl-sn-glycerol-3-phosphate acyltransferase